MKVYIVLNSYCTDDGDSEQNILGVYDTKEKAQAKLTAAYETDIEWLKDRDSEVAEWAENEITETSSSVADYDFYNWSNNWIEEREVE